MRVAVVVTVRNEASSIVPLLDALSIQTRPADQVIIVDGGSTDGTPALAKQRSGKVPGLHVIEAPGADIAHGRNLGIAASVAEIIAVTDAGCIPSCEWVAAIAAPLENDPALGLVIGGVTPNPSTHFEACVARCSLTPDIRIAGMTVNPTARSLAFPRWAWEAAGGFPEHPPFNRAEDGVFIERASRCGGVAHRPSATVLWRPRATYRAVLRQFYQYARGLGQLGASGTFHSRTVLQSAAGLALVGAGCVTGHWVPWIAMVALGAAYLIRKARAGCFAAPSWRTFYRVPAILATIHIGTMAGIVHGAMLRVRNRT
ncbi:MAG: glycosyltransferase [Candidatus Eisenbacteria bacterium]|jgi:glycosyltransferase involved in cell wall biosynthesis|nr:glycosyltransferase [Candidatus Eisenbacteria bacterium]